MSSERDRIEAEISAGFTGPDDTVIDVGDTVLCDGCSTDLTTDASSGGFLFGSYAYGPCCADDVLVGIKRYHEEDMIRAYCPPGVAFAAWVRELRGGNNTITFRHGSGGSLT